MSYKTLHKTVLTPKYIEQTCFSTFLDLSWKWEWSVKPWKYYNNMQKLLCPATTYAKHYKNPVNHVAFGWFFGPRRIAHKTADRQQLQLCSPQVIRYKFKQNIFGLQRTKSSIGLVKTTKIEKNAGSCSLWILKTKSFNCPFKDRVTRFFGLCLVQNIINQCWGAGEAVIILRPGARAEIIHKKHIFCSQFEGC